MRGAVRVGVALAVGSSTLVAVVAGPGSPLGASQAPSPITEFPIPGTHPNPRGIVAGPDGNLWYTDAGDAHFIDSEHVIGRMTPSGIVVTFPVSSPPGEIAVGPDGNLWFTEDAGYVARITTAGVVSEFPMPNGTRTTVTYSTGIAAGSDGAMWVSDGFNGQLDRFSTDGHATVFPDPGASSTWAIAGGADGRVWYLGDFTKGQGSFGAAAMTVTGQIGQHVSLSGVSRAITTGPDGRLWIATSDAGVVQALTPSGALTAYPNSTGDRASSITAGPDGALWMGDAPLDRVTLDGRAKSIVNHTTAFGVAAGPDGAVWFTDSTTREIGRLDLRAPVADVRVDPVPQPVGQGRLLQLVVTVSPFDPAGPVPTGQVSFTQHNCCYHGMATEESLGTAPVDATGRAVYRTPANAIGNATSVDAAYGGDSTYPANDSQLTRISILFRSGTQTERFVQQAYIDLLGRGQGFVVDPGISYWVGVAERSGDAAVASGLVHSDEYRRHLVTALYSAVLGRPAEPGGLTFWASQLAAGVPDETLAAALYGTDEYFAFQGGTSGPFLSGLYRDVLGRPSDSDGRRYWLSQLDAGVPRAQVAASLLGSAEGEQAVVSALYLRLVGRAPDPGGLTYWTGVIAQGQAVENVIVNLVGSAEYVANV